MKHQWHPSEHHLRRWQRRPGEPPKDAFVEISGRTGVTGYRASASELRWLDGAHAGKIYKTAARAEEKAAARAWLDYSKRVWAPARRPVAPPLGAEKDALSFFFHQAGAPGTGAAPVAEPIEPLHGIGRHPFSAVGCPELNKRDPICSICYHEKDNWCDRHCDVFKIDYLVLHNGCGRPGPKPRVLLFDLGASKGFRGVPGGAYDTVPTKAGAKTPSLPIFYKLYADRCLEPDDVFAWEPAGPMACSPALWWGELPPEQRAKVRFYNTLVGEDPVGGRPNAASFLKILEAVATPGDFVVVKLDVDTPDVEFAIIEAIAERPALANLIDELFFEYHYHFDGISFGWQEVHGDVDSALSLMHRLRSLGIRAHFWV